MSKAVGRYLCTRAGNQVLGHADLKLKLDAIVSLPWYYHPWILVRERIILSYGGQLRMVHRSSYMHAVDIEPFEDISGYMRNATVIGNNGKHLFV